MNKKIEIKKGQKFRCIKSIYTINQNKPNNYPVLVFIEKKIYTSEKDGHLTDELGNQNWRGWMRKELFDGNFVQYVSHKRKRS